MEGFKNTTRIKFFKEGGAVASNKKVVKKTFTESADIAEDKALVKKGVSQHESFLHKNEPKTPLTLKTGGRAKKQIGTAKKFMKSPAAPSAAVKGYKEGKHVRKSTGDQKADRIQNALDNLGPTNQAEFAAQESAGPVTLPAAPAPAAMQAPGGVSPAGAIPTQKCGGKVTKKC